MDSLTIPREWFTWDHFAFVAFGIAIGLLLAQLQELYEERKKEQDHHE